MEIGQVEHPAGVYLSSPSKARFAKEYAVSRCEIRGRGIRSPTARSRTALGWLVLMSAAKWIPFPR